MSNRFNLPGRVAAVVASFAFTLCLMSPSAAMSQHGRTARARHNTQQRQPAQQPQPQSQPKKKKLPPGVRGFDQFANRDASDKLIAGGATRVACTENTFKEWVKCGSGFYESGEYEKAVDSFTRAVSLEPNHFRGHYLLGLTYEAMGKYKEAAAAYTDALSLKPEPGLDDSLDFFKAQYNLANSLALSDQHEAAVATYLKLIDTLPVPVPEPHYNLGLSYAALGKTDDAASAFRKAVEIKPGYAEAHYNLGLLASRAERYADAINEFKQAINSKPDYADARYSLGLVYYLTDNRAGLAEQQKALQSMNSKLAADLAKLR